MTQSLPPLDLLSAPHPLLTTREAAAILAVSAKSLALWRRTGGGPPYVRIGVNGVRYRASDLKAYIDARVTSSTADEAVRQRH